MAGTTARQRRSDGRTAALIITLFAVWLLVLIFFVARTASAATDEAPLITVPAGADATVEMPGALAVDVTDPGIADAQLQSPGVIRVHGIREGTTILVILTADGVETRPIRVTPSPRAALLVRASDTVLDFAYLPRFGLWQFAASGPGLMAAASANGWRFAWWSQTNAWRLDTASRLPAFDLPRFGVEPSLGFSFRASPNWQLVLSTTASGLRYQWSLSEGATAGVALTTRGVLGDVRWTTPTFTVTAVALVADSTRAIGAISYKVADDIWITANLDTAGTNTVGIAGKRGLLRFAAATDGRAWQAVLVRELTGGGDMGIAYSANPSWPGPQWSVWISNPIQIAGMTGSARLQIDPSAVWLYFSAGNPPPRPSFAASLSPNIMLIASPASLPEQPPQLIRLRWRIPGPVTAVQPATPPPPPGQTLLIRACIDADADGTCGPADPPLALTVYLDGKQLPAWEALPVTPGPHRVELRPEDLPVGLTPTSPLTCDLIVDDQPGAVATCDFTFTPP